MNYADINCLVEKGCSTHKIASVLDTSQTNVRHWLRKFGLSTERTRNQGRCRCKCGEADPDKYYGNKRTICAKCDNAYTVERQRRMAQRIRDYLGGKCVYCNYRKFQVALGLHHTDPKRKDPSFKCLRGWSWKRVLKELEKCVLACHNCHSAVHVGLLPFVPNKS